MKKIASILLSALLLCSCGSDRSEVLKVFNWSCYIDEDVIGEFEDWYEEQTGETVRVIYQTFDVNETMLSKIEKGHEDFDVVCPSDYIIERMLQNGLLLPLNKDFGDTPNYIDDNLAPFIKEAFNHIDGKGLNANDYSVCYMWGTTGILYNAKYVSDEDAMTWDIIRNPKYADKIFIKDAPRDIYAPVLIHLKSKELEEGKVTMEELMYDSSDESLAAVEDYMKDVKQLVAGWEADFGKEQMTQEKGWVNMTWSGDAVWAIEEAAQIGVDLRYSVPDVGSTYWFDGWVIPKYAQNTKAAMYFINFMSRPDIVIRNVDVIGYVSSSCAPEVLESQVDESFEPHDLTYFFGPEADSVRANPVMYPDRSVIERCCLEHDWGEDTDKLISMWSRVKGENANAMTVVIISVTFAALTAAGILKRVRRSRRHRNRRRRTGAKVKRRLR